jgi:hypothetical protein
MQRGAVERRVTGAFRKERQQQKQRNRHRSPVHNI